MKKLLITAFTLVAFASFAQNQTRSLSSFDEVSVHEGIDVYLVKGTKEQAIIEESNVDLEDVLTKVSGGELNIHLAGRNHRNVDVKIKVVYKSLKAVSASSAADVQSKGRIETSGEFRVDVSSAGDVELSIKADDLDIHASSAGDAELEVDVSSVDASVSNAGGIEISGITKYIDVEASSSGDFEGYDIPCEQAEASASSGGSVELTVSEQLDARASSGGSIRYRGNPRMDISTSSGGSIKKN